MTTVRNALSPSSELASLRARARQATAARVFLGGAGTSYSTSDLLRLRADHALAKDAVDVEVGPDHESLRSLAASYALITLESRATSHDEYLRRPDLGRRLSETSALLLAETGTDGADLQVILGDGLSAGALTRHAPAVVAGLRDTAARRGWTFGTPLFIRRARVGLLNDVGDATGCRIAVLLIGERPGLQTPESMSAYLAYAPTGGDSDADRNLVCNIHADGLSDGEATDRIVALIDVMHRLGTSGVDVKEPPLGPPAAALPHAEPNP